jgi:hypothetical protein
MLLPPRLSSLEIMSRDCERSYGRSDLIFAPGAVDCQAIEDKVGTERTLLAADLAASGRDPRMSHASPPAVVLTVKGSHTKVIGPGDQCLF